MTRIAVALSLALICGVAHASGMWDPDLNEVKAIFVDYLGGQLAPAEAVKALQEISEAPSRSDWSRANALDGLAWIDCLEVDLSLTSYFAQLRDSEPLDRRSAQAAIMARAVRVFDVRVAPEARIRKLQQIVDNDSDDFDVPYWAVEELCALGEPLSEKSRAVIEDRSSDSSMLYWCDSVSKVLRAKDWGDPDAVLSARYLGDSSWSGSYLRTVLLAAASDPRSAWDPMLIRRLMAFGSYDSPEDLVTFREFLQRLRRQGWTVKGMKDIAADPWIIDRLMGTRPNRRAEAR